MSTGRHNPLHTNWGLQISESDDPLFRPPRETENVHQMYGEHFRLECRERNKHVYISGASRFGKSTLMERIASGDISTFAGVTILDPKPQGPLAESMVRRIPAERENDVEYLNIANPRPIDLMSWDTEHERDKLQGELFSIFTSFSETSDDDQWPNMLRAAINSLLHVKAKSLLDLAKVFANEDYLADMIRQLKNLPQDYQTQMLIDYWEEQFPNRRKGSEQAILSRLNKMIFSPLANLLAYSPDAIKIRDIHRQSKIFIVNLGTLSRDASNLIGRLIVSQLANAAFSQNPNNLIPHFLHADEFQNFQTSDFDTILSEAGGFHLCLCLANQGLYQLKDHIREAIFTNANCARIAFHLNHKDVSAWEHLLPEPVSLRLERGHLPPEYQELHEKLLPQGLSQEFWDEYAPQEYYEYKITPRDLSHLLPYQAFFNVGHFPGAVKSTLPPLAIPAGEWVARGERIKAKYSHKRTTRPVNNTTFTSTQKPDRLKERLSGKRSSFWDKRHDVKPRHESPAPPQKPPTDEPQPEGQTRPPHYGDKKKGT